MDSKNTSTPNTLLRDFVEQLNNPYNPANDAYEVIAAFDKPVEISKRKTPITDLHIYWSKKHPDAIRQYVEHYTQPNQLVLDPFCGSGMTALVCRQLGRHVIAIDLSPAATFITKNYASTHPPTVKAECLRVLSAVRAKYEWLYETRCDRCDGTAEILYTVYSYTTRCVKCFETSPIYYFSDHSENDSATEEGDQDVTVNNEKVDVLICPRCEEPVTGHPVVNGYVPVETSYKCLSRCTPKRAKRSETSSSEKAKKFFKQYDLEKINKVNQMEVPFPVPDHAMPQSTLSHRLYSKNITQFRQLYTQRNLWTLCALFDEIRTNTPENLKNTLLFILGTVVFPTSKMCRHDYPSTQSGTYYVPYVGRELSVFENFNGRINRKTAGLAAVTASIKPDSQLFVSTQSACNLAAIPANSIDYIFTDPPYGSKVPFWELNLIWEHWWQLQSSWEPDELIINPRRNKNEDEWRQKLADAFIEMYRVLKPGRWLSLCYHGDEMNWEAIQDLAAEAGFHPDTSDSAIYIDIQQKTFKQLRERQGERVPKRDLVVNFRKPLPDEISCAGLVITGDEDQLTFREKASNVIMNYLTNNPGAPRDQIYDALISYMVRRGDMANHDFDSLLSFYAEQAGDDPNRWYLKNQFEAELDEAETNKEANAIKRLMPLILSFLEKNPEQDGIRYSDLFEAYLYLVPSKEKPRRELKEFALDYLINTESGAYRPPADENESSSLIQARTAGTNRRIRRFVSALVKGLPVPTREHPNDATLAEWIRHCKRSGLYEQGKLLYEKGGVNPDELPEDLSVAIEEDYQVCVRMLSRKLANVLNRKENKQRKPGRSK